MNEADVAKCRDTKKNGFPIISPGVDMATLEIQNGLNVMTDMKFPQI